jgi:hypothetical protein
MLSSPDDTLFRGVFFRERNRVQGGRRARIAAGGIDGHECLAKSCETIYVDQIEFSAERLGLAAVARLTKTFTPQNLE